MASFKFDFFPDDDVEDSDSTVKSKSSILSTAPPEKRLLATCSSAVEQVHAKFDKRRYECRTVHVDSEELKVSQPQVDSTSTVGHIITTRDVLSGVYEGGLKVWECSLDLVRFLASHPSISGKSRPAIHAKSLDGAALVEAHASTARLIKSPTINVLELGCGHGLPGIFMLKKIPNSKVCFQDLNEEVLRYTTARNVIFNAGREVAETRTSFVRGDWTSVHFISKLLEIGKCQSFDIILAAETLYTKDSSEIMSQLLWRLLTPKTGVGLLASKKYYFGKGLEGGTDAFKDHVTSKWIKKLQADTVMKIEDKKSNIREIIKIIKLS